MKYLLIIPLDFQVTYSHDRIEGEKRIRRKEQCRLLCCKSLFPIDAVVFLPSRNNSNGKGTPMLCGKRTYQNLIKIAGGKIIHKNMLAALISFRISSKYAEFHPLLTCDIDMKDRTSMALDVVNFIVHN